MSVDNTFFFMPPPSFPRHHHVRIVNIVTRHNLTPRRIDHYSDRGITVSGDLKDFVVQFRCRDEVDGHNHVNKANMAI